MDRTYIELHDVVARYVKNELSDPQREAFEEYYFEHPDMLEAIESERLLRAAMRVHAREAQLTRWASSRQRVYALAASFLLGVMLASLLPMLYGEGDDDVAQVQTAWLIVDRQGGPVEIELATLDQPLALTIELSSNISGPLRAELFDANDKRLWIASNVTLNSAGDLTILMPVDVLDFEAYVLRLAKGRETVDEYRFEISATNVKTK